ncbi:guanylate kinase [bacterium]|nr:guanylate kinase [bacterium]
MAGKLFIIAGCSGVGKGTLIKEFLKKNNDIIFSVSYTTRQPRPGEENGVNYFFISKSEFEEMIKHDGFIEHAEFSGNYYGTGKAFIEKKLAKGQNVLLEIEVKGCRQVKSKIPDAVSIFILPPSLDELEHRLRGRNTESEEVIERRLSIAKSELEESKHFDYCVVNDNIENALSEMQKIYESKKG